MKLNQNILKAINEGIRKSLLSFDEVEFDQSNSNSFNSKIAGNIHSWNMVNNDFVDLDLPSGTLWCKYNLGANKSTMSGNYYAWAETSPMRRTYTDYADVKYVDSISHIQKYNNDETYGSIDNLTQLEPEDDAAFCINELMSIPTQEQWRELIDNTIHCLCKLDGKNCQKFASKHNPESYIIIPYVSNFDCRDDGSNFGYYWSSTLAKYDATKAYCMMCGGSYSNPGINQFPRYCGFPIRPVIETK